MQGDRHVAGASRGGECGKNVIHLSYGAGRRPIRKRMSIDRHTVLGRPAHDLQVAPTGQFSVLDQKQQVTDTSMTQRVQVAIEVAPIDAARVELRRPMLARQKRHAQATG